MICVPALSLHLASPTLPETQNAKQAAELDEEEALAVVKKR